MEIGTIHRDSFGHHPLVGHQSWLGTAEWASTSWDHFPQAEGPGVVLQFETLLASVPKRLKRKLDAGAAPRASMLFLPWGEMSGVGLVTLMVGGDEALAAVMDIAGRRDLHHLVVADAAECVKLTACCIDELDMCPSVQVVGAGAAIREAQSHRRLSAKEFQEAIEEVRWLLRSRAALPLLGAQPPGGLSSLTLNVVQPLDGWSGARPT